MTDRPTDDKSTDQLRKDDNFFCPGIQDSENFFKYEIRQNLRPVKFFKGSLAKAYMNMDCNFFCEFSEIFKISTEKKLMSSV